MFLKKATQHRKITDVQTSGGLIKITCAAHGLSTGNRVIIDGVVGVPANGVWLVTNVDSTNFTLQSSTFSGTWTNLDNAYVYLGDVVAVVATTYPGTEAHVTASVKRGDPTLVADYEQESIRKAITAANTDVIVAWADPARNVAVASLNVRNRHASSNLVALVKMLDYQNNAFDFGTATIEAGSRMVIDSTGRGDVITKEGRSASYVAPTP